MGPLFVVCWRLQLHIDTQQMCVFIQQLLVLLKMIFSKGSKSAKAPPLRKQSTAEEKMDRDPYAGSTTAFT